MSNSSPSDPIRDLRAYVRWLRREGFIVLRDEVPDGLLTMPSTTTESGPPKVAEPGPTPSQGATPALPKNSPPARLRSEPHAAAAAVTLEPGPPGSAEFEALRAAVSACRKCALGELRKNAVFGAGNPNARLVFIGEAPGATEDETGIPFVGQAGNQLTKELAKHGIAREDVFICNILKCRPPANRDPSPEEILACEPHLLEQLRLIKPRMVCGLGRYAVATLLKRPIPIMKVRGTWERYNDIPLFICLHPAAILHQPQNRPLFEADIKALAEVYHAAE